MDLWVLSGIALWNSILILKFVDHFQVIAMNRNFFKENWQKLKNGNCKTTKNLLQLQMWADFMLVLLPYCHLEMIQEK